MVPPFRRPSRDYVLMLLIVAAVLVLLVGIYLHEIQALLPIASMLLALRISLQSDDRNVRRFAGVLTFGFAASTLSNIAWYLVPAVVNYSFVGTDNYYYVTGMFWIIGYVAIAYVLLKLKNSRQWYLERRLDRGLTVAGVIACILIGLFVFLNMDWSSSHLTDIFILLIYLALDVMILMLAVKLLAMNLKIGLRHLVMATTIFFLINMAGDLLFVSRWLFNLSKLLTLQVGNFQTTLTIRNATNDIYNFSLTLITVLLFLFVLDPLRTGKIDEIRGRLKDTQLFVDDLIAKSPDATGIFDRHGRLVLVNDPFLQIFGLKRNDIDRSFNIFGHTGEKMFNKEAHAEMLKVRDAGTVIIPKQKLTGIPGGRQEDIYLYLKMFPTYGSGGRVSNYVMIIEDITARIEMEMALRQSEEKFRAVFEQAAVGITWVDLEGRFLQTNQKFRDITGYASDELTQRSVSDITYAPDIPEEKELIGKLLRCEIDTFSREKRYVRKDGSLIWVLLRVSLIRENGIPKNFVGVTQDITERKQFEEALRESEDKYRNIVEQSSDGILISDERGIIVEFNAAQARITGRDPKDWIGRYLWDYIAEITAARRSSPDQKESLRAAIMAACKGGYRGFLNSEMEVTIRRPDGEIRSINISSFVTNTHRGKIFGSMVRDVTERKRIEEALREREEQYRNLVENIGEWIWENDRESRFTYSSPKVYDLLGYRPEEVIGLAPHDLMTPENAEKLREQVKRLEETGEFPQVLEVELLHKDGHTVFLEVTGKPVYDRQGNHAGFRGVSRDVTARNLAEEALRGSEASLARAQAMAHIGNWEWDGRRGKSRWSDELYAICGLDKATFEPSYAAFVSLVHPDDSARVESHMGEAFGHKSTFNVDFRIVRPDGSERAVHCEGEIAIDKDGKPVKMFGTCQDITERIRLENELRNAYDSLKAEYERKIDFTNAAAHELRTPLTPIIGYTDILKSEVKDDRHRKFLGIIERNALRQKTLVNRMLELASLDAGMAHVNRTEFALRPLVLEIADNYRAINPHIRAEVPEGMRIHTDMDILRHVLDNLVSNAAKYSDSDKEIEIRACETGDGYQFSVRDRGAGIQKEEWGKIFERFYIVGGERDSRTSGRSGLGLALVKAYISLIGGQVWIESEPGKGSTFFFTVPRKHPSDGKSH